MNDRQRQAKQKQIERKRKDIKKFINSFSDPRLSFLFHDSDDTQYPDGICVKIKSDDFVRLRSMTNFDFSRMRQTYKEYCWFIDILKKYKVPYDTDSYEIAY